MPRPLKYMEIMNYAVEISRYLKPKKVRDEIADKFNIKVHRNTLLYWRKRSNLPIKQRVISIEIKDKEEDIKTLKRRLELEHKKLKESKQNILTKENNIKYLRLKIFQIQRENEAKKED